MKTNVQMRKKDIWAQEYLAEFQVKRPKSRTQVHPRWLILIIFLLLCYVGYVEKRDLELRKALRNCQEVKEVTARVRTHVWIMDKSCSDQLLNSADGILRIKTK